jgi:hypothetical protein
MTSLSFIIAIIISTSIALEAKCIRAKRKATTFLHLSLSLSLYASIALVDLGRFFISLILYTDGRTSWTGD